MKYTQNVTYKSRVINKTCYGNGQGFCQMIKYTELNKVKFKYIAGKEMTLRLSSHKF